MEGTAERNATAPISMINKALTAMANAESRFQPDDSLQLA
jgi:hypothetical protein